MNIHKCKHIHTCFQLGEHNIWGKHTNFEDGARVPLLIRAPGQTQSISTHALVELVDMYPTVAALSGLPSPPDLDGEDLSSLWTQPNASLKSAVFSEYPRCAPPQAPWTPEPGMKAPQSCIHTKRSEFTVMGLSVRTTEWRATFWMWWDGGRLKPDFSRVPAATELYYHGNDPARFQHDEAFDGENQNVADANPSVVREMMRIVKSQWS